MGIVKDTFKTGKTIYKVRKRVKHLMMLLDEEERPRGVVKVTIDWLPVLLNKAMGLEKPFSVKPYFWFYKAHFKIFEEVVMAASADQKIAEDRKQAEAALAILLQKAQEIKSKFVKNGRAWKRMEDLNLDEVFLRNSLAGARNDPNPLGRIVYQYPQLRKAQAERDDLVEELLGNYTAMRICRQLVLQWMEAREARIKQSLDNKYNIRKIPGMAARHKDDQERGFGELNVREGTPQMKADAAIKDVATIVEQWATELDERCGNSD